jgi:hypothetical protein
MTAHWKTAFFSPVPLLLRTVFEVTQKASMHEIEKGRKSRKAALLYEIAG